MINKHNKRKYILRTVSTLVLILISVLALSVPCLAVANVGASEYQNINSTFPLTVGFVYDRYIGSSALSDSALNAPLVYSVELGGYGNNYAKAVSGSDSFEYYYDEFKILNKIDYNVDKVVYPESARLYLNSNDYISRGYRGYSLTPYGQLRSDDKSNLMLQRYEFYADDIYINTALLDGKYSPNGTPIEYGIPFIEMGDYMPDVPFRAVYKYEYSFDLCTSAGGYRYDLSDEYIDKFQNANSSGEYLDLTVPLIDCNFLLESIGDTSEIVRIENFVGKLSVGFYQGIFNEIPIIGGYKVDRLINYTASENSAFECRIGISSQPLVDYDSAEIKFDGIQFTSGSANVYGKYEGSYIEFLHGMGGLSSSLDMISPNFSSNDTYYIYVDYIAPEGEETLSRWLGWSSEAVVKTFKKYDYDNCLGYEPATVNGTLGKDYSQIKICLPFYDTSTAQGAWGSSTYNELFAYPNAERFWKYSSEFWYNPEDDNGDNNGESGGAGPGGGANGGGFGSDDIPMGWENINVDFVGWIGTAVGGFMSAELFPGFTLGGVLGVLVSFSLVLVLLKYLGG